MRRIEISARVATPKLARTLPRIMTEEELNGMLDRIARVAKVGDVVLVRDYAILELLYASGLRVSELVGLDLRQVNFGGAYLEGSIMPPPDRLPSPSEIAKEKQPHRAEPDQSRENAKETGRGR